jgi:hypothetical protein
MATSTALEPVSNGGVLAIFTELPYTVAVEETSKRAAENL